MGLEGYLFGPPLIWGYQGHVNNVMYIRYAESARVNWTKNYATHRDPKNRKQWAELMTPRGHGLILKSILTEFKFVRNLIQSMRQDTS